MQSSSIQAVIFDLGETLLAVPPEIDEEVSLVNLSGASEERVDFISQQLCQNYPGLDTEGYLLRVCDALGIVDPERQASVREAARRSVLESVLQEDALRCLGKLRERGLRLCLISNTNPLSWERIRHHGLEGQFNEVIFSCDVGLSKPDPRIFELAFRALNLAPEQVCAVGDKVRTLVLGVAHLGTAKVLVERRATRTVLSERLVVDAMVPSLDALCELRMLGGQ